MVREGWAKQVNNTLNTQYKDALERVIPPPSAVRVCRAL
jgi:hypothetical protein